MYYMGSEVILYKTLVAEEKVILEKFSVRSPIRECGQTSPVPSIPETQSSNQLPAGGPGTLQLMSAHLHTIVTENCSLHKVYFLSLKFYRF